MKILSTLIICASLFHASAHADDMSDVMMDENAGCLTGPMEQFGRYLGNWTMKDYQLDQDGVTWTPRKGAKWNFMCIGNGIAVQDFWMPNGGGTGTNLRILNAKTGTWDIAWTSTSAPSLSHITAEEQDDGTILMHYISPTLNPERRITFFPPTKDGWNWQQEMSFSADENTGEKIWTVVYKMQATRE